MRYVVAVGATEKGAVVECLAAQVLHRCRAPERVAGREADEEARRRRRREKFAKSWRTRDTAASLGGGRVARLRRDFDFATRPHSYG